MRGKLPFLALIVAAFAVATGSVVVLRATSGTTTGDTARLVPADTAVYATVNTDAASRQWAQVAALLSRLGVDSTLRTTRDQGLQTQDLNWTKDVAPYLGGEATVALTSVSADKATGVVILSVTDGDKAWAQATKKLDKLAADNNTSVDKQSYRGEPVRVYPGTAGDMSLAITHKGRYLIGGTSADEVESVLDREAGKGDTLASAGRFHDARGAVAADPLLFVYVNPSSFAGADSALGFASAVPGGQSIGQTLHAAGLDNAAVAIALTAESGGVRLEYQTVGLDSAASGAVLHQAPDQSSLATQAPADTLLFVSGTDLYGSVVRALTQAGKNAGAGSGPAPIARFHDALTQISQELGFDVEKGLLAHLTGEFGFALGADAVSPDAIWGLALSAVDDTGAVSSALPQVSRYLSAQGLDVAGSTAAGTKVTQVSTSDSPDQVVAYALTNNALLAGYGKNSVANALAPAATLADDAGYRAALALLPKGHALSAYVNLQRIVKLAQGNLGGDSSVDWKALGHLRFLVASASQSANRAGGMLFLRIDE